MITRSTTTMRKQSSTIFPRRVKLNLRVICELPIDIRYAPRRTTIPHTFSNDERGPRPIVRPNQGLGSPSSEDGWRQDGLTSDVVKSQRRRIGGDGEMELSREITVNVPDRTPKATSPLVVEWSASIARSDVHARAPRVGAYIPVDLTVGHPNGQLVMVIACARVGFLDGFGGLLDLLNALAQRGIRGSCIEECFCMGLSYRHNPRYVHVNALDIVIPRKDSL